MFSDFRRISFTKLKHHYHTQCTSETALIPSALFYKLMKSCLQSKLHCDQAVRGGETSVNSICRKVQKQGHFLSVCCDEIIDAQSPGNGTGFLKSKRHCHPFWIDQVSGGKLKKCSNALSFSQYCLMPKNCVNAILGQNASHNQGQSRETCMGHGKKNE